jgi:hypothetical protein
MPAGQIVEMLIQGAREESGPLALALNEEGFTFPPLPNLFFPRDIGMVIGRHAVVGSMRYGVRWTEELLIKALFRFHPELANAGLLYDGSEEKRSNYTLEGGDVHYLRPDLLVVGFSERTSPAALDALCATVFERAGHRRRRGGDAQGADRHPPRHDLQPRDHEPACLPAFFIGPSGCRCCTGARARGVRRCPISSPLREVGSAPADLPAASTAPGRNGAVELGLQFLRCAPARW